MAATLAKRIRGSVRCFSSGTDVQFSHMFTEDQLRLRDSLRKFVDQEIQPLAVEVDKNDKFPHALWQKLGEFGFLGVTAPEEYGGLNMSYLDHIVMMEEISRASASIGLSYGAHSNLCVNQIVRWGTKEQKEKYLPKLISGEYIGALAMSEPGSGSDVVSMKMTATNDGDFYLLNGNKMWITNGPSADVVVVYAKTDPSAGSKGITAFIAEKKNFTVAQKLDKLGMRGSETGELCFDGAKISKDSVLGTVNQGVKVLMSGLDAERLVLSGGPIGLMQACMDVVIPFVNTRKQFNQYIGDFQLIQGKLADMHSRLSCHRAFLYTTANAYSLGKAGRVDCASVILTCAEAATWVALQGIQLLGGNGYINEYPTGRFLRDAKLYEIGAGTSEIRRMLIGRELNDQYRKSNP
eukprot:GHVL01033047.1.p1 GENE.GHVL01033047.1~~GHVL01033047.1.p1  ORF type:complete len:408 (+),score=66.58 GHVL01033047.1:44-1267(+)